MNDISLIRSQFPAICHENAGIYLDSPGGTQVPVSVIDAMTECLIYSNANLGGCFKTSQNAEKVCWQARIAMMDFINANSEEELIFGQNMTSLTFNLSHALSSQFSPGDEIILTRMDHDANVSPWLMMARDYKLKVKFLDFDKKSFEFNLSELDNLLTDRTKLICFNHASNMTGTINDVKSAAQKAHEAGALIFVDSVQFAPHGLIDVQDIGCDFLVCSPYKFFGPHMGVLWGKGEILADLKPYKVRPAPDTHPDCLETGTLSHEGMAGVTAAVDYFSWIGERIAGTSYCNQTSGVNKRRQNLTAAYSFIKNYEMPITRQLIDGLSALPNITIQGISKSDCFSRRVPTVSFTIDGYKPREISQELANNHIYVWDGHNYAIEPINHLGLMDSGGVIRVGLAHYNTEEEVEKTLKVISNYLKL